MQRVTGIGGIFFKARDPDALRDWYRRHLGIDAEEWGGLSFRWHRPEAPEPEGVTVWTVFPASSDYFPQPFMINYRVADLDGLLATPPRRAATSTTAPRPPNSASSAG